MDLSLNWLKKYVALDGIDPDAIALKLTMATAEVEEVHHVKYNFDKIYLAEIINVEDNSEDPKLKNLVVRVGSDEYKTVCGAPNVRKNMISVFALPGAVIDGKKLEAIKSYKGYPSQGMLVSVAELGMADYHLEIIEAHSSEKSGTPLKSVFPEEDFIIEIDNKSLTHRPDLWGHYGFARELAAVYDKQLEPLALHDLSQYKSLPAPMVKIEDYENCPRYACLNIDNLPAIASPMWLQYNLLQAGARPINLPVDLTNFVALEIGQPMHAFDGDKIEEIRIGKIGKNETFITLDDAPRKLIPEDLMIFNKKDPVAIAGIMGGASTEVSKTTKKITLESANFYASRIRRTSTRLGLRTDASQRFEKAQPHSNTVVGIQRFAALSKAIEKEVKISSSLFDDKAKGLEETSKIKIKIDYMLERIGAEIPLDKIKNILVSLGFDVEDKKDEFIITVPPFRSKKDISIPEDIVEEVARVYGYDNIEMELPSIKLSRYNWNDLRKMENEIKKYLSITCGMNEVQSHPWFDEDWCNEIEFKIPKSSLKLLNPSAESLSRMKTTLMPNLLKFADNNSAFFEKFKMYEMGRTYNAKGKTVDEEKKLGIVFADREKTSGGLFSEMKGSIRQMFKFLFNKECDFKENTEKGMQAGSEIYFGKTKIGWFGVLDDNFLSAFRKGVRIAYAELSIDKMGTLKKESIDFKEPHKFPGSWLDFSIVTDKSFMELVSILDTYKNDVVVSRDFSLVYEGKGLEKNQKSYTFRYTINYVDHTPSGEEIQEFKDDFIAFLNKHDLHLR